MGFIDLTPHDRDCEMPIHFRDSDVSDAVLHGSAFFSKGIPMATIVIHNSTNQRYVLVGAGFGAFQSKKPNWFLGDLMADTTEGHFAMTCVCDKAGNLCWIESEQLTIISVDGVSPSELLEN